MNTRGNGGSPSSLAAPRERPASSRTKRENRPTESYCEVKIAFGIIPWMPLVPSTTWVT
jgi:hypothetical protein